MHGDGCCLGALSSCVCTKLTRYVLEPLYPPQPYSKSLHLGDNSCPWNEEHEVEMLQVKQVKLGAHNTKKGMTGQT